MEKYTFVYKNKWGIETHSEHETETLAEAIEREGGKVEILNRNATIYKGKKIIFK